ncbi:PREDICTED: uncharacterized protein LOC109476223 [Branchiostoma belcheri]|uniref:Uncharacterized protein LOC109476223 n=1 Tax=Branchiostoma belcheri TaxID=7741 RepID=A0A6P4ZFE4_BRABE|nr:PREDICTED: uncharacterized protein LOC109476223 [Branchiostoma belcheri]
MGRKLRHLLIFLLIILKEPNMPEAVCSCRSSFCNCNNLDLTNIPQNLPASISVLQLSYNPIKTVNRSGLLRYKNLSKLYLTHSRPINNITTIPSELGGNPWQCDCRMAPVWLIPALKKQIICAQPAKLQGQKLESVDPKDLMCKDPTISPLTVGSCSAAVSTPSPESAPSSPLPVLIGSVCGPVAGIVLIGTFLAVIWYKRRTTPPLGLNPAVVVGNNTNTAASVVASGHDQTGQGQSQAITESTTNTTATVMASGDDNQYEDIDKLRVKTGQGQSQAITESNTNTTATVTTSGHDQTGQGQSQANIQSLKVKVGNLSHDEVLAALQPNTMYVAVKTPPKDDASSEIANSNDQTGQGQSQAGQGQSQTNTECNTNTTATVMTSNDDQTGQRRQASTEKISGHDQTGQGQSGANIPFLKVGYLSYNEVLAALQPNAMSLQEGNLPSDWKVGDITPIFKKGSKRLPGNYRPVSLTSVAGKIMEGMIRDDIVNHMRSNNLFTEHQHGFLPGRSTTTQLLECLEDWTKWLDNDMPVDVIYMDYQKAFDSVPIQRLLIKTESYGIKGKPLQWIGSFLTGRKQRVVVNGSRSSWAPVSSGVPQGSVLGPVLFTLYVNDMPEVVDSTLKLFADDTKLYRSVGESQDCQELQNDLDKLQDWAMKYSYKALDHPHKPTVTTV